MTQKRKVASQAWRSSFWSKGLSHSLGTPALESNTGKTSPLSWFENLMGLTRGLWETETPLLKGSPTNSLVLSPSTEAEAWKTVSYKKKIH